MGQAITKDSHYGLAMRIFYHYYSLYVKSLSCVRLFVTPWTVAYQAPPSMGFSRQWYWSGLPFPSLGDLPNPEIKPGSPALQTDPLPSEPSGSPIYYMLYKIIGAFLHKYLIQLDLSRVYSIR